MSVVIRRVAADRRAGMTVAELRSFAQQIKHAGIDDDVTVKPAVGWRGQLTTLEVEGESPPAWNGHEIVHWMIDDEIERRLT